MSEKDDDHSSKSGSRSREKVILITFTLSGAIAGLLAGFLGGSIVSGALGCIAGMLVGILLGTECKETGDVIPRFHVMRIIELVLIAGIFTAIGALSNLGWIFGLKFGCVHGAIFALARTEINDRVQRSWILLFQNLILLPLACVIGAGIGALAGAFSGNPGPDAITGVSIAMFSACYALMWWNFFFWMVSFNRPYVDEPPFIFILFPGVLITIIIVCGVFGFLLEGSFAALVMYLVVHLGFMLVEVLSARKYSKKPPSAKAVP